MAYVRHEARLDRRDKESGVTLRATLELRAAQGSSQAIADLASPAYPESLDYLLDWSYEVLGRSGVGMDGLAPLSWECLDAWARRTKRNPTRDECHALMQLDSAFRHPDEPEESTPVDTPKVAVVPAWPVKAD
jgi:hypothetical protein